MRALVCILLAALALTAPVLASAAQEELYGDLGMSAAESAAPKAARETLGDLGIMDAVEPEGMLSKLLDAALEDLLRSGLEPLYLPLRKAEQTGSSFAEMW